MSHIYKALQQAEMESGTSSTLGDAASFVSTPTQAVPDESAGNSWLRLTSVVRPATVAETRVVTITDQSSLGAEKFRLLRTRLRHLQDRGNLKEIVVTSSASAEGKTTVAVNLAISLARHSSQKVLLLEGDLRCPALQDKLGLRGLRGLRDWFENQEPLPHFVYRLEGYQLWFLPAGHPGEDALKILQSDRFAENRSRLRDHFDWIVVDSPPLMPLADVHLWVERADGVLLVVRDGTTRRETLAKGLNGLNGAKLLGVVLNDSPSLNRDYYRKHYSPGNSPSVTAEVEPA